MFLNFSTKYLLRVHKRLQAHFLCWVLPDVHSLQMIKYSPKAMNSIDWETDYTRWSSVELSKLFESLCYCLSSSVIEGCFVRSSQILFWKAFQLVLQQGRSRGGSWVPVTLPSARLFWPNNLQQVAKMPWRYPGHSDNLLSYLILTQCNPHPLWKILAMPLELLRKFVRVDIIYAIFEVEKLSLWWTGKARQWENI